jgi:hypothetical protein
MPDCANGSQSEVGHDAVEKLPEQTLVAQGISFTASGLDQPFRSNDHR